MVLGWTAIRLRPNLTWWDGAKCTFAGKPIQGVQDARVPDADPYGLLAYTTAFDLPGWLLVYAKGEGTAIVHWVWHARKGLEVGALELSGPIEELRARVGELAGRVRALRGGGRG